MKSKIQITILTLSALAAGFLSGSYYPADSNIVKLEHLKQGLFIIHNGDLYTVSKLVTDNDTYQKIDKIK